MGALRDVCRTCIEPFQAVDHGFLHLLPQIYLQVLSQGRMRFEGTVSPEMSASGRTLVPGCIGASSLAVFGRGRPGMPAGKGISVSGHMGVCWFLLHPAARVRPDAAG